MTWPPLSVRAYFRVTRGRARLRQVSKALLDGCFLGLMDRDDLSVVDRAFYSEAREAVGGVEHRYTETEHITSGLASWEAAALNAYFAAGARVVVTAAGGGREVVGLLERGFDPIGFEPNEELAGAGAAVLAAAGDAHRLRICRRDEFPAEAPATDGVVIGWGSYMLIPGRHRRIAMLAGARARLQPGAPLLVSFFVRSPSRYFAIVHAIAAPLRRLRRAEPVELGDALSPNFTHHFSRAEIESELAEAGFMLLHYATRPYPHAVAQAV